MNNKQDVSNKFNRVAGLARRAGQSKAAVNAASYEAAAFTNQFDNPYLSHGSPPWRRLTTMLQVADLLQVVAKSKRKWFTVARRPYCLELKATPEGASLVNHLNDLGSLIWASFYAKRVDPRLTLLFDTASQLLAQYGGWETGGWHLGQALSSNPVQSELLMNEVVQRLRVGLNNPIMSKKVHDHEHEDVLEQGALLNYFKPIVAEYPQAIVIRCELRQSRHAVQFGSYVTAEQARVHSVAWVENMKAAHGDAVVGLAFRMAFDPMHGWYDHVLLIMNGPTAAAHEEIASASRRLWLDIAGLEAIFVDCKGHHVNLSYRGRRLGPHGGSLVEELIDASFFLTRIDHLLADDLHGRPVLKGRGKLLLPKEPQPWRRWGSGA